MKKIIYIQYNSSNKDRARENRNNQTKAEMLMRGVLRKKQLGYTFLRQKMIDSFVLDFSCSKLMLGIEVDGESHKYNQKYDIQRDEKLRHIGIKIIRYRNEDVFNHIEGVREDIVGEIKIREKEIGKFLYCYLTNPPQPSFIKEGARKHPPLIKGGEEGFVKKIRRKDLLKKSGEIYGFIFNKYSLGSF